MRQDDATRIGARSRGLHVDAHDLRHVPAVLDSDMAVLAALDVPDLRYETAMKKRDKQPCVPFVRVPSVRCPRCYGVQTKILAKDGGIRYHRCDECGCRFRSVE